MSKPEPKPKDELEEWRARAQASELAYSTLRAEFDVISATHAAKLSAAVNSCIQECLAILEAEWPHPQAAHLVFLRLRKYAR